MLEGKAGYGSILRTWQAHHPDKGKIADGHFFVSAIIEDYVFLIRIRDDKSPTDTTPLILPLDFVESCDAIVNIDDNAIEPRDIRLNLTNRLRDRRVVLQRELDIVDEWITRIDPEPMRKVWAEMQERNERFIAERIGKVEKAKEKAEFGLIRHGAIRGGTILREYGYVIYIVMGYNDSGKILLRRMDDPSELTALDAVWVETHASFSVVDDTHERGEIMYDIKDKAERFADLHQLIKSLDDSATSSKADDIIGEVKLEGAKSK